MNEVLLTASEAYWAMFYLLDAIYDQNADASLGEILGAMQLDKDGTPFDSAYKEDWLIAIEKVRSMK